MMSARQLVVHLLGCSYSLRDVSRLTGCSHDFLVKVAREEWEAITRKQDKLARGAMAIVRRLMR